MSTDIDWARSEVGQADLGDKRLTERLVKLVEQFEAQPFASIPQACGTNADTQAAYDFFDNNSVKFQAILKPHRATTLERIREHSTILAVQDTVLLNYSSHPKTEGLGAIGTKAQKQKGIVVHATLAITPEGSPLGLLDAQAWTRPDPERCDGCELGPCVDPRRQPIEDKESYKWLLGLQRSHKDMPPGVRVVSVCDRESDIFEFFDAARERAVLVRAAQNRNVETDEGTQHLWAHAKAHRPAGTLRIHIPARANQAAREAELTVCFGRLKLKPPRNRKPPTGQSWTPVPVWFVLTQEINPPEGVEPVSWLLLTTVAVHHFQDACERIAWYGQRWKIEVFFDVLENGCKVEDRRLRTNERLLRCIAVYMIVAIRLQRLTYLAREQPEASCLAVLSTQEWQTLYYFITKSKQLPDQPLTLRQAVRLIAQLGGFLGRKGDGEPGIRTVWRGWQRLQDLVAMWQVFHEIYL